MGGLPVQWRINLSSVIVVTLATIAVLLSKSVIKNYHNILLFFDSIELGFFTLIGIQTQIVQEYQPEICIALGTTTAFVGTYSGFFRVIIPLFSKKNLGYNLHFGGLFFFLLQKSGFSKQVICLVHVVFFRLLWVRFNGYLSTIWKTVW